MVLNKLLSLLMAHPRVGPQVVQRLSETWPIRRAARFTAFLYFRGKHAIEEGIQKDIAKSTMIGTNSFKEKFKAELQKGIREAQEDLKRKQNQR